MKIFSSLEDLYLSLGTNSEINPQTSVIKANIFDLAATYVFSDNDVAKSKAKELINTVASDLSIFPASIYDLYSKIGRGEIVQNFTVPAINIRTLTFDTSAIIFKLMQKNAIGPVIFEIAKSEMGYTKQRPDEYTTVVLAGAISSGYSGPVFIQGDHFQLNAEKFKEDAGSEVKNIENLIAESIAARFLQIDIDASTLVDLSHDSLSRQQQDNFKTTAHLTSVVRKYQPSGITIAIGGEIGHIGGKNSTPEEFEAFMQGYSKLISSHGISKVSVQTGSSHGGVPLSDGTIKKVAIDFSVLSQIGKLARDKYQLAGAVQHGASTLPLDLFTEFPKNNTAEVHLATGFQNTVYDHLPKKLVEEMYTWVEQTLGNEHSPDQTREQFIYKSRKKAFGPFKKHLWELSAEEKQPILNALTGQFSEIFTKLNLSNTKKLIADYVR